VLLKRVSAAITAMLTLPARYTCIFHLSGSSTTCQAAIDHRLQQALQQALCHSSNTRQHPFKQTSEQAGIVLSAN